MHGTFGPPGELWQLLHATLLGITISGYAILLADFLAWANRKLAWIGWAFYEVAMRRAHENQMICNSQRWVLGLEPEPMVWEDSRPPQVWGRIIGD